MVEGIWGGNVRDENITIPANSTHTEWTRCVLNKDVDVIFLASHMHKLGKEFTIRLFDGTDSGDIFTNDDWHNLRLFSTRLQFISLLELGLSTVAHGKIHLMNQYNMG